MLLSVGLPLAIANLGSVAGLAGLAGLSGLAGLAQPVNVPAVTAPIPQPAVLGVQPPVVAPVTGMASMVPTSSVAPATPVISATATAPPAPAPPTAPPAPVTGTEGFGYMVGTVGLRLESTLHTRVEARARVAEDTGSAAVATAPSQQRARAHRRSGAVIDRGYRHEYLNLDSDTNSESGDPPDGNAWAASAVVSDNGAGILGFAGTVSKTGVTQAAGLATLAGDGFGGGPRVPMVPDTWKPGQPADPSQARHET